jgi:3-hydroxyisobutyrate dehydrogenase-like beta-hydroxyacid dehydrogenase
MGKPMAKRLLEAGHHLRVYNRSRRPIDELAAHGATPTGSPREAASGAEFVILMLPDTPEVVEVVLGVNGVVEGASPGTTVIDMSTVSPETEREVGRRLADVGVKYLDAPVTGGTIGAEQGTLTIMVGGDYEAFGRAEPILSLLGNKIIYMGPSGSGQLAKLCNQVSVALSLLGTCEALLLASKAGLDLKKVLEAISTGAGSSWQLVNLGPRIMARDFDPGFKAEHLAKDLRIVSETAHTLSLPLPGTAIVYQLLKSLVAKGKGALGTQALITVLEELASHHLAGHQPSLSGSGDNSCRSAPPYTPRPRPSPSQSF